MDYHEMKCGTPQARIEAMDFQFGLIWIKIQKLLASFGEVRVTHIYRKSNKCVDAFANLAGDFEEDYLMFDQPPCVQQLL